MLLAEASAGPDLFLGEDLLLYLLLAFGGALMVGNLLAVFRPPPQRRARGEQAPMGRSLVMAAIGGAAFLWALVSLLSG